MLLAQGKTLFFDKAKNAIDFFSAQGYSCPRNSNPADFFMNIMSIESLMEDEYEGSYKDYRAKI